MISANLLESICREIYPELFIEIDWGNVWRRPLDSGEGFEWAVFLSMASEARKMGLGISLPLLQYESGKDFFSVWNQIPKHYVGKVGHSSRESRHSLASKFCFSLVPKLIISDSKHKYSVFREGCPYHAIMSEEDYDERPDILILDGSPAEDYPCVIGEDQYVRFKYDIGTSLTLSGSLRVINSSLLPIEYKHPEEDFRIPVRGIVECSTNKPENIAREQLKKYEELFGDSGQLNIVLVTGNRLSFEKWPSVFIDLEANTETISSQMRRAGMTILQSLSLI